MDAAGGASLAGVQSKMRGEMLDTALVAAVEVDLNRLVDMGINERIERIVMNC